MIFLISLVGLILSTSSFSMSSANKEESIRQTQKAILHAIDRAKYSNHYQKDNNKPTLSAYFSEPHDYLQTGSFELNELAKYDVIFMPVRELEREEKSKKNMKLPIPVTSGLVDKVSKNNRDLRVNGSLIDNLQTLYEQAGTQIGITIPKYMIERGDDLIAFITSFLERNTFIDHISIDFGSEVFPNGNNGEKYQSFIVKLHKKLSSYDINLTISIASGVPKNEKEAHVVKELLNDNKVNKWYFSTLNTAKKLGHHMSVFFAKDNDWSAIQALTFLINSGIEAKRLELEYSNMNYPIKESSLLNEKLNKLNFTDTMELSQKRATFGKKGYELMTDSKYNLDFICAIEDEHCFATESPRMIAVKANLSYDKGLGGLFTRNILVDSGLNHNAAREGLGYKVTNQMFAMNEVIKSLGNIKKTANQQTSHPSLTELSVTRYANRVLNENYTTEDSSFHSVDYIDDFLKHLITNYPLPLTYSDTIALKRALDKIKETHDYRENFSTEAQIMIEKRLSETELPLQKIDPVMHEMMLFEQVNVTPEHCKKINEFRLIAKEKGKDYIPSIEQLSDSEAISTSFSEHTRQDLMLNDWKGLELKCAHPTIHTAVTEAIEELKVHIVEFQDTKRDMLQQHISQYINRKEDDIMAAKNKFEAEFRKLTDEQSESLDEEISNFKAKYQGFSSPQSTILQRVHSKANTELRFNEKRSMDRSETQQATDLFDFYVNKMMLEAEGNFDVIPLYKAQDFAEHIKLDYFPFTP